MAFLLAHVVTNFAAPWMPESVKEWIDNVPFLGTEVRASSAVQHGLGLGRSDQDIMNDVTAGGVDLLFDSLPVVGRGVGAGVKIAKNTAKVIFRGGEEAAERGLEEAAERGLEEAAERGVVEAGTKNAVKAAGTKNAVKAAGTKNAVKAAKRGVGEAAKRKVGNAGEYYKSELTWRLGMKVGGEVGTMLTGPQNNDDDVLRNEDATPLEPEDESPPHPSDHVYNEDADELVASGPTDPIRQTVTYEYPVLPAAALLAVAAVVSARA